MNSKTHKINPIVSGAAGAVVGAGIGMAAGAAANDAKTRKTLEKVVHAVKEQAENYMKSVDTKKGMEEVKKVAQDAVSKASKNSNVKSVAKKVLSQGKKATHK